MQVSIKAGSKVTVQGVEYTLTEDTTIKVEFVLEDVKLPDPLETRANEAIRILMDARNTVWKAEQLLMPTSELENRIAELLKEGTPLNEDDVIALETESQNAR